MLFKSQPRQDPMVEAYCRASSEVEATRRLGGLLQEAEKVALPLLRQRLGAETAQHLDDCWGEVRLVAIGRLVGLRQKVNGVEPIQNLRGFVRAAAFSAWHRYLTKKYPRRSALKKSLEYLLGRRGSEYGFAIWSVWEERVGGYAAWQEQPARRSPRYLELLDEPRRDTRTWLPGENPEQANPALLLAALFRWTGGPVELDDLVHVVAQLRGVRNEPLVVDGTGSGSPDDGGSVLDQVEDPRQNVAKQVEWRVYLQELWAEIRQLPPQQATALLLNLRFVEHRATKSTEENARRRGVIELFPVQGIAWIPELAAAMEMTAEALAAIWNHLPFEDAAIARFLGCTEKRVRGLRKAAKAKLGRHLADWLED
jgi:hypothetical protein